MNQDGAFVSCLKKIGSECLQLFIFFFHFTCDRFWNLTLIPHFLSFFASSNLSNFKKDKCKQYINKNLML